MAVPKATMRIQSMRESKSRRELRPIDISYRNDSENWSGKGRSELRAAVGGCYERLKIKNLEARVGIELLDSVENK